MSHGVTDKENNEITMHSYWWCCPLTYDKNWSCWYFLGYMENHNDNLKQLNFKNSALKNERNVMNFGQVET